MINYSKLKDEHKKLSQELSSSDIYNDKERYQTIAKRFSFLGKIVDLINQLEKLVAEKKHLEFALNDPKEEKEMKDLASEELPKLEAAITNLKEKIEDTLFEQESEPDRDVIIEIRSAAGGEEAALFAAVLFKMYSRYIEKNGWKQEVLSSHSTEIGGFKEVVFIKHFHVSTYWSQKNLSVQNDNIPTGVATYVASFPAGMTPFE